MCDRPPWASRFDFEWFDAAAMDVTTFRAHLRMANDAQYRYMAIYHRAPLFFNADASPPKGIAQMFAAHWLSTSTKMRSDLI